jgi:hypothetical protein
VYFFPIDNTEENELGAALRSFSGLFLLPERIGRKYTEAKG